MLVLGLALGISFLILQVWEHRETRHLLELAYQERARERLDGDTRSAETYLANLRDNADNTLRAALKTQVGQAIATLDGLYQAEHAKRTPAELQRSLLEALRKVRFFDGRGYYFVDEMKGRCLLLPIDPTQEGRSLWDNRDDTGRYVMRALAQAATSPGGEGFVRYRWYAPDSPTQMRDKIAYVERFAPFGWVVGAGDYLYRWEADLKARALGWLRAQDLGDQGSYMVLERSGRVLLAPDQPSLEGLDLYNITNATAASALRQARELALRGGGTLRFAWSDRESGGRGQRVATVSIIPGWDWILITARPDDASQRWLQRETLAERDRILRQSTLIFALVLIATCATLLVSLVFSRRVEGIFTRYRDDLENRNQALQDSEGLLQSIFNAIPDLMWLKDRNGVYLACNTAFGEYFGASREQIRGRTDYDFVDRDTADFYLQHDRRAIEHGGPQHHDEWVTYPDGHRMLLETVKTPVRNATGLTIGVLGIARDITARRSEERELAESRALQALVVAKSPLGIALFRGRGKCVLANQVLAVILGEPTENLLQRDMSDFPIWRDPAIAAAARTTTESGYRQVVETNYRERGADELWLECQFNRVERDGQQHLLMICADVTARHAAEAQQRLAASVFEHSHEGITITDAKARILDVNPTFTAITGYTRDEALGQTPALLSSGIQGADFYAEMWRTLGRDGYWRSEIWNRRKNGEIYAELLAISAVRGDDDQISHYVGVFSDITLVKEQQRRLDWMAYYDPLTQLPNRTLLADRIQQAIAHANRDGHSLAICYLDLDGFKPINDTYGHDTGDKLLLEVAQRLKQTIREDDTVARLGGDEFVLLLTDLNTLMESEAALQRVLSAVASRYPLDDGSSLELTASLGVTFYPGDSEDPDTLLRHADQAMYQAKQEGRNCFHVFDAERHRQTRANRDLIDRLGQALAQSEFRLHYQPKVDMRRHTVVGAEALIRWQHPEQGLLAPSAFLPVLTQSPLALEVGRWVLETAVAQAAEWHTAGYRVPISVNVTGPQLLEPNFVPDLKALLDSQPGLPAHGLELEILESSALQDVANISKVMNQCHRLGVGFALDDFGTGYSTLTYLRRLPADVLKVDQSFVRGMLTNPEDLAIVKGITGLARAFRRSVIAEGVETLDHATRLLDLGCDLGQGYGIAMPMPPQELPGWIDDYQGAPAAPPASA